LANKKTPPVKERLEMPRATQKTDSGLTIGLIKILHNQLSKSDNKIVKLEDILTKWKGLNLPKEQYDLVVSLGGFQQEIEWNRFMAITCSIISKDLIETLTKVCQILTSDEPGSNARIKFTVFKEIYSYLVMQIEKSSTRDKVEEVSNYLETEWANRQNGYIHPMNFKHDECPTLSELTTDYHW
jgi:hypothetical protein